MAELRLLCGPRGCGRTRIITRWYADTVGEGEFDAAVLLLPARRVIDRVTSRLVSEHGLDGLLDARIYTFPMLAETILRANHAYAPKITRLQRELLVSGILDDMADRGELEILEASSRTSGLVGMLLDFIDELKRAAVRSEQFTALLSRLGFNRSLDRELSTIYTRYQRGLQGQGLYDEAGQFWEARDLLRSGHTAPLEAARLILVDGFSDFTTTEIEVLKYLSETVEATVVTLPLPQCEDVGHAVASWDPAEDGLETSMDARLHSADAPQMSLDTSPAPNEASFLPRRTFERLRETFESCRVLQLGYEGSRSFNGSATSSPQETAGDDALRFLRRHLFDYSAPHPPKDQSAVTFMEAETPRDEIRGIAQRVKSLVREGVSPEDIYVGFRSPDRRRSLLVETFEQFGIPLYFSGTDGVAGQPLVQLVMSMLNIVAGDFRREDVVNFLRSELVDVTAFATDVPDADVVYTVACQAGIVRGWSQWNDGLSLYRRRLAAHRDQVAGGRSTNEIEDGMWDLRDLNETEQRLQQVERVQSFIEALRDELTRLPETGLMTDHVAALGALMQRVGLSNERIFERSCCDEPELSAASIRAFDEFCDALRQLFDSPELTGVNRQMERPEFIRHIDRLVQGLQFRPDAARIGRVQVLDLHQLRQLRIPHLFLPDLSQGTFPARYREDIFYDDSQRRKLADVGGLGIRTRTTNTMQEAFLMCSAVSAATEHLYLSFAGSADDGSPQLPSIYFEEAERVLESDPETRDTETTTHIVRDTADIYGQRALREFAFSQIFGTHPDTVDDAAAAETFNLLTETDGDLLPRAVGAAVAEARRYSREPFDEFDGVLDDAAIVAAVAQRFGEDHTYSPSQLGAYGQCPFRFFLQRVLGLSAVEEPDFAIDAASRGTLVHRIMARFFRNWRADPPFQSAIREGDVTRAQRKLEEVAREVLRLHENQQLVAHQGLWRLMCEQMMEDLREFPAAEARYNNDEIFCPLMHEAQYGYGDSPPVEITNGGLHVRVGGRIDRVDIVKDPDGAHLG
ncbi:MAG: PD-(D/E)XK nuclease family protein, partial [Armatimonadota bacterium]